MASEMSLDDGDYGQCHSGQDVYETAKLFVKRLKDEAGMRQAVKIMDLFAE